MFPERLSNGYHAFLDGRFANESKRYKNLGENGQNPQIMLISCSDSRVSPEVIFDAGPGEMFVVRNVANLIPPFEPDSNYHGTSAAIEFAVNALKVQHIVVMGHAACGGIKAALDKGEPLAAGNFIGKWMSQLSPLVDSLELSKLELGMACKRLERASVTHSLTNLMTFPYIKERVEQGLLQLHGAHFGIATGVLSVRDPQTGEFHPFSEPSLPV